LLADQIAANYRKADIDSRQKAMLDFAMKIAFEAYVVGEEDFAALAKHGLNEDDAWDIAAIASFFGMSNRMANFMTLRPNDEFYSMGR
jgi:4-carboxymuconolactone decarboxylase